MTTPIVTSTTDSQMHNNIIAAGSRDRPPMLATGRYAQWRSRFLRYINTRPNGDAIRKCILEGPYTPSTVVIPAVPATENSLAVPEQTTVETILNMSPENKAHFESEKEAIHLILTGIEDEIYSTEAIKRLQQGESLNIQDVMTDLFWEFGKFTSHDGETMESYYIRFYKPMNEMIRNNLIVATMQVNVQFLQQLQPEWSRFVTIVKQKHKLDEVSYHKLFDILKQYQKEVNELRAERIAKTANPLALVATAQPHQDSYYQTSKSNHQIDPEQAQKDKEMQKNLALIAKYFKKIYKPTNNNLKTSSNTRNKNVDTTPRETKPKRVKDSAYHKEKNVAVANKLERLSTTSKQSDKRWLWLADTDEEIDEQELEAHYSYMAKIQEVPTADSGTDSEPLEQCKSILAETSRTLGESNSIRDSCLVALQNKPTEFERYKNLNDRTVDYKKLENKLNETLGLLAQKYIDIKEGLKLKAYKISVVKEKHDELVKQSLLTKSNYEGLVKEKTKVRTDLKLKEEKDIDKMISMEKQLKFLNETVYKRNQSIKTIHMLAPKGPTFNSRPTFTNPMYLKKAQSEIPCLYVILNDQSDPANKLVPDREETLTLKRTCLMPLALKTQNDSFVFVHEPKQEMHANLKYVESLEKEIDELESDKTGFLNMYDMLLKECVSNDVICSYLHSLSNLDAHTELQCLYLHKVKECDCLAQKLSKKTESVSKEVYTELLRSFDKLEKHSISLALALQQCQEQMKNDTVCKEKTSNVFRKEREQYFEIQDLKAQLQDKNIAIRMPEYQLRLSPNFSAKGVALEGRDSFWEEGLRLTNLRFVEEPVEIMDREIKSLKRSKISLVKVRLNSKCGPEFTWEREDYMKSKYPQLFVDRAVEPTS
ncbi:hypothetical protein Tco_1162732 [Tanacetum coccineum]